MKLFITTAARTSNPKSLGLPEDMGKMRAWYELHRLEPEAKTNVLEFA
jgi:hypothetical protein